MAAPRKRCLNCGKALPRAASFCPHCHIENDPSLVDEESRFALRRMARSGLLKAQKKRDAGMALLVVGSLLAVIGIVFLFLSFRYNIMHERVFIPKSLEFVVCCVSFALGGASLIASSALLLSAHARKSEIRQILKGAPKEK